ncbi:MAG: VOC family protein [Candidatus Moraniibacteriota bacterium]
MIDHVSLYVKDFVKSKAFYEKALAPIGYKLLMEFDGKVGGFGEKGADLWVIQEENIRPAHIAFRAEDEATVKAFYDVALAAGGTDNGAPGPRPQYDKDYYAAFVFDLDGHNIEVMCRKATSKS